MATVDSGTNAGTAGAPRANVVEAAGAWASRGSPVRTLKSLPAYSRSLLRISVPVVVVLAQKRQTLGRIVEFGPGSIIQFEKSCDGMLELRVGDHSIAVGEAVKVGDKFGLRVASMVLPGERFEKVERNRAGDKAAG